MPAFISDGKLHDDTFKDAADAPAPQSGPQALGENREESEKVFARLACETAADQFLIERDRIPAFVIPD